METQTTSLSLIFLSQDALNLQGRPFLHNSTLITLIVFTTFAIKYKYNDWMNSSSLKRVFPWLVLVSVTTHHLRDSVRRGLWFPPFGSTVPLNRGAYVVVSVLLPLIVRMLGDRGFFKSYKADSDAEVGAIV